MEEMKTIHDYYSLLFDKFHRLSILKPNEIILGDDHLFAIDKILYENDTVLDCDKLSEKYNLTLYINIDHNFNNIGWQNYLLYYRRSPVYLFRCPPTLEMIVEQIIIMVKLCIEGAGYEYDDDMYIEQRNGQRILTSMINSCITDLT